MTNLIEIRVTTKNDTGEGLDAAKADAAAAGAAAGAAFHDSYAAALGASDVRAAGGDVGGVAGLAESLAPEAAAAGEDVGAAFSDGWTRTTFTEADRAAALSWASSMATGTRAAIVAPLADIPAATEDIGAKSGEAFTGAFQAEAARGLSDTAILGSGFDGAPAGQGFAVKFASAARSGIEQANIASILGDSSAFADDVEQEATATGTRAGTSLGTAVGESATKAAEPGSEGMSKLIVAGLVTAAAVGPAAILTGMAAATVGATALVLKSNVAIAADYKKVGADASAAVKAAAAPLTGDLNQALVSVDGSIKSLTPGLKTAFAGAGPDIATLTTGVENLASSSLPGIGAALNASQADVAGFASGLTPLGAGIGSFFTGITRDSATTGAGIQSVMGVLGNTLGTVGTVVGSASSVISADLMAVDPVVNTLLTAIRGLSSPATIGGLAGAFGAMKLDPSISSGLGNMATSLTKFATNSADAEGGMTRIGSAASSMGGALSKGAGIMGGPWGIAIGASIGLASGLAGSLIQAAHASDGLTLSQQGLSDAISKDGGVSGAATAAYVAQSAVQDGLAASASAAGVSLATWTSAVTGNKAAQEAVTAAVDKSTASAQKQEAASQSNASSTGKYTGELQGARNATTAQATAADTLYQKNQQLLASMNAMAPQIASTISAQQKLDVATMELNSNTLIFNATLDGARTAAQLQAQTAAQSSVALLGLGDTQSTLNMQLVNSETAYAAATGAAGAYNTVLTSLNGSTMTADQAQNTLAQDMLTAKTSFKQNGESLDLNTQAGINNRQALTQAATAIQALGVANINSGGNINTANAIIQQQATAFVNATGATGKAKTAIQQYLAQIDQLPPSETLTVIAATTTAENNLLRVQSTLNQLKDGATIPVYTSPGGRQLNGGYATGGVVSTAAVGGSRGGLTQMNEQGAELVNLPNGSTVTPASNVQAMAASGMFGGGGGTVQLEWVNGGGDQFTRFMVQLLRQHVIAVGGGGPNSVQRAFGQVS